MAQFFLKKVVVQKFYSIGPKQNAFPDEPNLKMKNCSRFKSKAWKKFFCVKLIPLHFEMFFQLSIVCDNNSSSLLCPALPCPERCKSFLIFEKWLADVPLTQSERLLMKPTRRKLFI